ncbi:MAG TPA: hypothetical protein VLB76_09410 [Thermoanaerobaculia bacterium]|jgi:hypothetical protein|nr:hypothetical protein [Thermoanaerobaculia bacterium]
MHVNTEHADTELLIGAIFVLFSALDRFNTPETNRSSTTALRYYLAAFSYLLFGMMLYLGLAYSPVLLEVIKVDSTWAHSLKDLPVAPFAALLLTVLLPKVPILAEADNWIREQLQEMGSIPHEARRLAAELRKSPFSVPPHVRGEVTTRLRNAGFHPNDIQFEDSSDLRYFWTKASVLMIEIEEWESDRRFIGFLSRFSSDFDRIQRRYRALTPRVKNCLRLLQDVTIENESVKNDGAVLQFQTDLTEQLSDLLGDLYSFISRGLLQCGTTYNIRAARLTTLGFDRNAIEVNGVLSLDQLMIVFGFVGVVVLSSFALLPNSADDSISERIERAMLIASLYSIAVVCALYPKDRWKLARRDPRKVRPVTFYALAGAMAAAISLSVNFGFQVIIHQGLVTGWGHFLESYPWALSSFVTAFMLALMSDDQPTTRISRRHLRWVEGLIGAGSLALTSLVIRSWLAQLPPVTSAIAHEHVLPPLIPALVRACIIGFAVSYLVPTWYREAPRGNELPEGAVAGV